MKIIHFTHIHSNKTKNGLDVQVWEVQVGDEPTPIGHAIWAPRTGGHGRTDFRLWLDERVALAVFRDASVATDPDELRELARDAQRRQGSKSFTWEVCTEPPIG